MRTLITGASSGLGEGMARGFAARGHDLALAARRTDRLDALAAELRPRGARVETHTLDVTDHDAVFATVRAVRDAFGGLDRVVVNAGIGKGAPVGTGRADANVATLRTNLVAALVQCEAALEVFRAQGSGHLVVISSVAAERGLKGAQTAYAASKAGLSNLAEGIRADVAGTGIDVTTIAPGFIATEINAGVGKQPFGVDGATGARKLVEAIDRRPAHAYVPEWPWSLLGPAMSAMPLALLRRLT